MKTLDTDIFPINPRLTPKTLPYEVRGSNQSLVVCHATSPAQAIEQYQASFPDEEFHSIECLRSESKPAQKFQAGETAVTRLGEEVVILRSRMLDRKPHYETNLEAGAWISEDEFRFVEVLAA